MESEEREKEKRDTEKGRGDRSVITTEKTGMKQKGREPKGKHE